MKTLMTENNYETTDEQIMNEIIPMLRKGATIQEINQHTKKHGRQVNINWIAAKLLNTKYGIVQDMMSQRYYLINGD